MPRTDTTTQLTRMMGKLLAGRKKNMDRIAKLQAKVRQVDEIFTDLGIALPTTEGAPRRGPKPGMKRGPKAGRRRRRVFAVSGDQLVLSFVKKHGKPSTAEVNAFWQAEGRGGKADNTLTKLVKSRQLKRVAADDARGSRYILA